MSAVSAVLQPSLSVIDIDHPHRLREASEVDSLDAAIARVRQLAQRRRRFVANTDVRGERTAPLGVARGGRSRAIAFDEALAASLRSAKVESVNVNAQDVGEEYVDMRRARGELRTELEARLIALWRIAPAKLQECLSVERDWHACARGDRALRGRMRFPAGSRARCSTLTIAVHERAPIITPVAGDGPDRQSRSGRRGGTSWFCRADHREPGRARPVRRLLVFVGGWRAGAWCRGVRRAGNATRGWGRSGDVSFTGG
jgi:hypothetical protein